MQYVAGVTSNSAEVNRVKEQLLQSNPVLEGSLTTHHCLLDTYSQHTTAYLYLLTTHHCLPVPPHNTPLPTCTSSQHTTAYLYLLTTHHCLPDTSSQHTTAYLYLLTTHHCLPVPPHNTPLPTCTSSQHTTAYLIPPHNTPLPT